MLLSTVLIEDSPTIRENLIPALLDLGGATVVEIAETEVDALRTLTSLGNAWHLAVVDIFLREGSGLAVLRGGQSRMPHQRMVALTNYATSDMRARCLELGADAVFDKSQELDQFFEWCSQLTRDLPK